MPRLQLLLATMCFTCFFPSTLYAGDQLRVTKPVARTGENASNEGQRKQHDILDGFDKFVARVLSEWKVPGVAVAIVHDDKVILAKGYGYRDIKRKLPVTSKTLFPIASVTKPFVATAAAILVDERKLNWDDPVRKHLPAFRMYDAKAAEQLTVRDCLAHCTGLPLHGGTWFGVKGWPEKHITPRILYQKLQHLEPTARARTKYQYSNSGYFVTAEVIRRISGQSWDDFLRERLLTPLGMKNSTFSTVDSQKSADYACPHVLLDDKVYRRPFFDGKATGPAGGINSNVEEMSRFLRLYLNQGEWDGKRIVSKDRMSDVLTPQIVLPELNSYTRFTLFQSMGWQVYSYEGKKWGRHTGSLPGFTSVVGFAPQRKCAYVVLTNLAYRPTAELIESDIRRRLVGKTPIDEFAKYRRIEASDHQSGKRDQASRRPVRILGTKPSHPPTDYVGTYSHPAFGEFTVSLKDKSLRWESHGFHGTLKHYHYDTFDIEGDKKLNGVDDHLVRRELLTFQTSVSGKIESLTTPIPPAPKDIVFRRTRGKKPTRRR